MNERYTISPHEGKTNEDSELLTNDAAMVELHHTMIHSAVQPFPPQRLMSQVCRRESNPVRNLSSNQSINRSKRNQYTLETLEAGIS